MLDDPIVKAVAATARQTLVSANRLPTAAVVIQAIAFDKTPAAIWKVTWHQDPMFPLVETVNAEGFTLPSRKDGVDHAHRRVLHLVFCKGDAIAEAWHRAL